MVAVAAAFRWGWAVAIPHGPDFLLWRSTARARRGSFTSPRLRPRPEVEVGEVHSGQERPEGLHGRQHHEYELRAIAGKRGLKSRSSISTQLQVKRSSQLVLGEDGEVPVELLEGLFVGLWHLDAGILR